jgi:hypothetical protein
MKRTYFLIAAIILFTACQKGIEPFDGSNPSPTENALLGTWRFVSVTAHTESTQEYTESGTDYKTVGISDYTTTDSTGTITFDDSTVNSKDISYKVSSKIITYNYQNDVLIDTTQMPFSAALDSTSSSGKYELIGSDSIYFPEGFIYVSDVTTQSEPSGGRISINGNMLTITQSAIKDTVLEITGIPFHTAVKATAAFNFQKQ